MSLDAEKRQSIRQMSHGVASTLTDKEKSDADRYAVNIVAGLREICDSDESVAKVAEIIAKMHKMLSMTPLLRASEVLDNGVIVYALACGNLAGVYELPEREPEDGHKHGANDNMQPAKLESLGDKLERTGLYL